MPPLVTGSVPVTPVVNGRPVPLVNEIIGFVFNTTEPVPVDTVTPVPPFVTGKVPVTPVVNGNPVALVRTANVGVPIFGVTRTGLVFNTLYPVPVDTVTPVPPFVTGKVPVTPVVNGRPVALVRTANVGTPMFGVTRTGLVFNTLYPVPVDTVTPVPPFNTGRVPVTPVVNGNPVALVRTANVGIPIFGVIRTGLVFNTTEPVPVDTATPVPPFATGRIPEIFVAVFALPYNAPVNTDAVTLENVGVAVVLMFCGKLNKISPVDALAVI